MPLPTSLLLQDGQLVRLTYVVRSILDPRAWGFWFVEVTPEAVAVLVEDRAPRAVGAYAAARYELAGRTVVQDLRLTRSQTVAELGRAVEDLHPFIAVSDVSLIAQRDLSPTTAPADRADVAGEQEAARKEAGPVAKLLDLLATVRLVVVLGLVVAILVYAAPAIRAGVLAVRRRQRRARKGR